MAGANPGWRPPAVGTKATWTRTITADDVEDRVDLGVLDAEDDRGVRLLEEPARAMEPGGAILAVQECVD